MNKINLVTGIITILSFISGCCEDCKGRQYPVKATFYYVNETSVSITNDFSFKADDIPAHDTLVIIEKRELDQLEKPTIDNYSPRITTRSFFYKDSPLKCEFGAQYITNYENRKQLASKGDTLVFEFTFRFTEEKRAKAEPCLE